MLQKQLVKSLPKVLFGFLVGLLVLPQILASHPQFQSANHTPTADEKKAPQGAF
jgi:hypothetical protein